MAAVPAANLNVWKMSPKRNHVGRDGRLYNQARRPSCFLALRWKPSPHPCRCRAGESFGGNTLLQDLTRAIHRQSSRSGSQMVNVGTAARGERRDWDPGNRPVPPVSPRLAELSLAKQTQRLKHQRQCRMETQRHRRRWVATVPAAHSARQSTSVGRKLFARARHHRSGGC